MPPRTTRIFVARIHPSVTEVQFRSYFEAFGKLQDAYMPKDHAKQGYRGIGFVTYASPDSVEKIMASKHWLNGHEIAIDRATPKEEPANLKQMFQRLPLTGPTSRRSFDNGASRACQRERDHTRTRLPAFSTGCLPAPLVVDAS